MAYVSYTDLHVESHEGQVKALDDIDSLITRYYGKGSGWCEYADSRIIPKALAFTLLDPALFLNLSRYVSSKLEQDPSEASKTATVYLYRRVVEDRYYNIVTPNTSVEMASALINLGADVNRENERGVSLREEFLNQGLAAIGSESKLRPQYLPIMRCFLAAGARPSASGSYKGHSVSVREFINQYVSPHYPAEAAGLQSQLERVLSSDEAEMPNGRKRNGPASSQRKWQRIR